MFLQTGLFIILITVQVIHSLPEPLVHLPNGCILGRRATTLGGCPYLTFRGIPFASPPIGELRFRGPQPPKNWCGVLNTTYFETACYQISNHTEIRESEDCLYLNVHTPGIKSTDDLLPVMLYIHGGGFTTRTGVLYSPDFFIDKNVILVTINYRHGVFGFLSTQDEVIPGNNGFKDQLLAIEWTNNNIELFGGDPKKITIFGESVGSHSMAFQLLNQNSEGLFRGAILQSGTFLCPSALQRNARQIAYGTAAVLNPALNDSVDSQALLEFLQTVDAQDLNEAAEEYTISINNVWDSVALQGLTWSAVIEPQNPDAFLTEKMYDSLIAGDTLRIPIIIGITSEENIWFNRDPNMALQPMMALDQNLSLLVPDDMQITDLDDRTEMGRMIRDIYTGGGDLADNVGAGIRYGSDNYFNRAVIKHAEIYSGLADTYFYQLSYDGEMGGILSTQYEGTEKVSHEEDLFYLFCLERSCNPDYPPSDFLTRERLVTLWTNFAKYQNPTPEKSKFQNIIWPKVDTTNGDFLYLDIGKDLQIKNHPKEETYREWMRLYDSLNVTSFDTY